MVEIYLDDNDIVEGNGPFLPVVFCLDVSGSMEGRIQQLQNGLRQFIDDVNADEVAKRTAQGAIITFSSSIDRIQDFAPVKEWRVPTLTASGATNLVGAVDTALQMLDDKKRSYQANGCTYYQPWLVLLSDGEQYPKNPTGVDNVAAKVSQLATNNKLVPFSIGVGDQVCWEDMKKFSKDQDFALEMKSTQSFREFFKFFSASVSMTSRSTVTAGHQLDVDKLKAAFNVIS